MSPKRMLNVDLSYLPIIKVKRIYFYRFYKNKNLLQIVGEIGSCIEGA